MKYLKMMNIPLFLLLQNLLVYSASNNIQVIYDFISEKNKANYQ